MLNIDMLNDVSEVLDPLGTINEKCKKNIITQPVCVFIKRSLILRIENGNQWPVCSQVEVKL